MEGSESEQKLNKIILEDVADSIDDFSSDLLSVF